MDILSELDTLKADYSAATNLLEEAKLSQATFEASLADKDSALSQAASVIETLNASNTSKDSAIADLEGKLADLTAKQKSAEQQAVAIVASQGIAPLKVDAQANSDALTKDEVIAKLSSLEGMERAEFYFANKTTLYGK